ncbi:hypothetical protein [Mycobacterium sp. URHB0021]
MPDYEVLNGVGWTPSAEERGYRPPAPPEPPFQPPQVTVRAVKVDGSIVEQAHAAFSHAKDAFEKFLDGIPREHYSPEGLTAQIAKFSDTEAAKAVDTALANVRARADQAAAQVDRIRAGLSPNGDVAAELRAGRYWDRTKAVLDSAKEGAFGKAQKLIADADGEQLGTLLQELPAYLAAHGHPSDWIDTAVGQVVPEYAQAAKRLKKAKQAAIIAEFNARSLRASFGKGLATTVITDARGYDPDAA